MIENLSVENPGGFPIVGRKIAVSNRKLQYNQAKQDRPCGCPDSRYARITGDPVLTVWRPSNQNSKDTNGIADAGPARIEVGFLAGLG